MNTRITLPNVLVASQAVQKLMESSCMFQLEPLPNGRYEIAAQKEAINPLRALAVVDDGHPVINWQAVSPDRIAGFVISVPGVEKKDIVGRLLARSHRFSFDGMTDFEVESHSLEAFDYSRPQWVRLSLGVQTVAGPVPGIIYIEEEVN
jgi:hypothetical protein